MKPSLRLCLLGLSLWAADALEVDMDQSELNRQHCSGMYSRTAWGGPVDPFILVNFPNSTSSESSDPIASLIIFEWRDKNLVGVPDPDLSVMVRCYASKYRYFKCTYADMLTYQLLQQLELCRNDSVQSGRCNATSVGEFIIAPNANEKSNALILTKAIHLKDPRPIRYSVKKTGYYCIVTDSFTKEAYSLVTEFRNAYGELPATQVPKLPFYGGMSILYALVCVFWGFLYYQHRHDILAVQNYITAILVFLVVEMLITWAFYGSNVGSKVVLIIVGILNAARNSFSFFLLLIVCMGYGVVKPTLGRTMVYVRWLAVAHFVFGLVYAITSLLVSPESAGPFVLLIVLPLAGTLTAFYVWTLNSLNFTLKDLRERKQHTKEAMYKKLWWAIFISVLVIFGFFFFNSFTFASINDPDFVPYHWKTRWFVLDGWLNIVYFADVVWIAYVWRPTANNRRFAMSDEIAQDDGNFEIGDIGVSGISDDEEEAVDRKPAVHQPPVTGITNVGPATGSQQQGQQRDITRDSLEGETIFTIGEERSVHRQRKRGECEACTG